MRGKVFIMFIIPIFIIMVMVGMGVGMLVGTPVPTKESIVENHKNSTALDMQGRDRKDVYYFISALNLFKMQLQIEGIGTWKEVESMAVGNIPPVGNKNIIYRKRIKLMIGQLKKKAERIIDDYNEMQKALPFMQRKPLKSSEDSEVKQMVLYSAIEGMVLGAQQALVSGKTKKVPGMLDGR